MNISIVCLKQSILTSLSCSYSIAYNGESENSSGKSSQSLDASNISNLLFLAPYKIYMDEYFPFRGTLFNPVS